MWGPAHERFLNTFLTASWIVSFPFDETRGRDFITGVALRASGPRKRRRCHGARGLNAKRIDVATKLDVPAVRASHGGADKSVVAGCLLVIPGSSEYDLNLLRTSQRLAAALHAEWAVVFVQTLGFRILPDRRRKKLEVDPFQPSRIITEPGIGYRLLVEPSTSTSRTAIPAES
jgi:hypothetical protein